VKFWITKTGTLPIREQLARQVMLAILSEDLTAGQKLPSIRALARRYHIHSNTVSAAYHDLLDRGWLELRRGSGLYVRSMPTSPGEAGELDVMLADLLRAARMKGYDPEAVLQRLEHLILPREFSRIAIVEPDPAMREILLAEIGESLRIPIEGIAPAAISGVTDDGGGCLVAALPTRAMSLRGRLPRSTPLLTLRLRSVRGSLETQTRPAANAIVSIVSRSAEFRFWARAMLIAVGLDAECLCEVDANNPDWQERARAGALVVGDVVAAGAAPAGCEVRVFRVIADSSLAELRQMAGS